MDWQTGMNQALGYIESHLDSNIDFETVAKMNTCSEWEFRRIFSLFASVPLSEYIRNRRLTAAAEDIRNGEKVIDVSLKYGYDSTAAFSRAFKSFHGIAPSAARKEGIKLKFYPPLSVKVMTINGSTGKNNLSERTNIIGATEVNGAISIEVNQNDIHKRNQFFWDVKGNEVLGAITLPKWGAFVSEEKCKLLGDVTGKKLLEIGCGRGASLAYNGMHNAAELWGIDISENQIKKARENLDSSGISAELICSPMEKECGIPQNYFDCVYSVYAIGWTTDLIGTFCRIASYLKKDGVFIFSWSHPIHKCVAYENDGLHFKKSYFNESWYSVNFNGGALCLADRKLSTYVNSLVKAGFMIEELVEESDEDILNASRGDFAKKAKMLPATFVIKARKVG